MQGRIEVDALVEELQIGEGELGLGGSHLFLGVSSDSIVIVSDDKIKRDLA